jgi:hypothetical protein
MVITELSPNPSLKKRGIFKFPFSLQEKGQGDEFQNKF